MENVIFNESCLDTMDRMEDNYIDITVTSPHYNVGIDYNGYNDKIPFEDYRLFITNFLSVLLQKTKVGGRLCLNVPSIIFDYENNNKS